MTINAEIDWGRVSEELRLKQRMKPASGGGAAAEISAYADRCLDMARKLVRPEYVWAEKRLTHIGPQSIDIEGPVIFLSRRLPHYVKGATHINVFVATIDSALEDEASRLMSEGESLCGYLLDSVGSLAVESLAAKLESALREHYEGASKSVSMRLSPGYCDWPVEEQNKLAKLVDFGTAGVSITEKCMMVPKKSVSAFVAIGPVGLFSGTSSQCSICEKTDCDYRRK